MSGITFTISFAVAIIAGPERMDDDDKKKSKIFLYPKCNGLQNEAQTIEMLPILALLFAFSLSHTPAEEHTQNTRIQ